VLQVLLDEVGLTFGHVDATSGGTLNLAMYCQGMAGARIADNWRRYRPISSIAVNWREILRLPFGRSLLTLDRMRDRVFPAWGLNWEAIRSSDADATFNVYNFSRHELRVLSPSDMTPDLLLGCISLPMWFPPLVHEGDIYIDAAYVSGANIEEAIARGADEIWVIWTIDEKSKWRGGFVNEYFQILEATCNGSFRRIEKRIETNNANLASGQSSEFGRYVGLKILRAAVPLHYLVNFRSVPIRNAVDLGVETARRWCAEQGIQFRGQAYGPATPL
jgi:predicted acylesterase/phospholipase RssA